MSGKTRWLLLYFAALFLVAAALTGFRAGGEERLELPALRGGDPLPDLVGVWVGTWEDTVYMVGGALSFQITPGILSDFEGYGEIDLSDLWPLGVQAGTAFGDTSGNMLTFTFAASDVGAGSGSITANYAGGGGTVIAPLSFGDFVFEGDVTDLTMSGSFEFTGPSDGKGIASLEKQTPATVSSWSEVKAIYRGGE